MEKREEASFGRIRSFLWPIHAHELKKFLPMFLIFFLIAFIYNLLRASKDTMIITAKASGAEAIPFIKVWFMLPMAFGMT
ncbi:MAG: Npt1/Npt2 family nucleotide transporter, partial [Chlamydiota bacterium]